MPSESSTTPNAYSVDFWRSCMRVTASCATCAESVEPRGLRVGEARAEASGHEATALKEGRSFRIFTNSMSEFWEDLRELDGPRRAALATMRETPHLTWMILTSRPEAILGLLKKAHNEALAEQSLRSSENGHRFVQWLKDWLARPRRTSGWAPPSRNQTESRNASKPCWRCLQPCASYPPTSAAPELWRGATPTSTTPSPRGPSTGGLPMASWPRPSSWKPWTTSL